MRINQHFSYLLNKCFKRENNNQSESSIDIRTDIVPIYVERSKKFV